MDELLIESRRTNELLNLLLTSLLKPDAAKLGLGPAPRTKFIYANRQYPDCLWYFWSKAKSTYEPIMQTALTGFIKKIELETKKTRGKEEPKVNIHVNADIPYVIQSGADTLFTRGLMYTISTMSDHDLRGAITIEVEAGTKDEQALFSKLYNASTGAVYYASYAEEASVDWSKLLQSAMNRVNKGEVTLPQLPKNAVSQLKRVETDPVAVRKSIAAPERKVDTPIDVEPLTGQINMTPSEPSIVDSIMPHLKNAKTLRDFTVAKSMISSNSEELGAMITEKLMSDYKRLYLMCFPEPEFARIVAEIHEAKDKLNWTPNRFKTFLTQKFPNCETTAHLTMDQIRSLKDLLNKEIAHLAKYGSDAEDFAQIPY